jgi:hypothetical protein
MDCNIWKVDYSNREEEVINCIQNYEKILFLLDTTKTKFDLIEKVVYDIAMFHFKKLNIDFNPNEHFIEFWFKNTIFRTNKENSLNINSFHCDCDENEKKINKKLYYPLLSCVSYFNESKFPTLLTEINVEDYNFKNFENKNEIQFIFPNKNKQITFNGSNFHGVVDIFSQLNNSNEQFDRYMLAINLWNRKPLNIYYNNKDKNNNKFQKDDMLVKIETNQVIKEINLNKNLLDFNFYEQMLYNKKDFVISKELSELIENKMESENNNFKINFQKEALKEKNNNVTRMLEDINKINISDNILCNRFLQRFTYNKVFSKNVCTWIIHESEQYAETNGGWTTRRHENYPTTDIPIEKIKNIFNFVLFSFSDIFNKIKKSFCFTDEVTFDIRDLFVVKYHEQTQNKLDLHCDGSFLSINVLLSDTNDFEGGGTYFDDGLSVFLEQGDVLVHSGKIKHAGLPISKGTRYIMVAFVAINVKINNT